MRNNTARWSLLVATAVTLSGCDSLLQVSNPNNISGEDVLKPEAAEGLVNGTEALIARGYSLMMASYSTITDELDWVGSRDSYREHDQGNHTDPFNEFTDAQFQTFAQSRWMADETIRILTDLDAAGELDDDQLLARAHINRAMIYSYIGDFMDDFPIGSDRQEGGTPLGEAGMGVVYTEAAASATTALGIADASGSLDELAGALLARAQHGAAVWATVGNRGSLGYTAGDPQSGLVSGGATAAAAALASMGGLISDWVHHHEFSSQTVTSSIGGWVNSRQEMKIGPTYGQVATSGLTIDSVILNDPIDGTTVSPILVEVIGEFTESRDFGRLRVTSAREMQLIIAEDELANGDRAGFAAAINALRALDGLTDYTNQDINGGGNDISDDVALLMHMRQTTLFLQGRRLADHYRFSDPSPQWVTGSTALAQPGSFLPIPAVECRSNPNIPENC